MKAAAHKYSLLTMTALMTACVSQRDGEKEMLPAPPPVADAQPAERMTPIVVPEAEVLEAYTLDEQRAARSERAIAQQAAAPASALRRMANAPAFAPPYYQQPTNTEQYEHHSDNPVHRAAEQPVSTFSIDVDTGAYANVRRFLNDGQLPPQDAVRVEEMINYFDYQYAQPADRSIPFKVATELTHAPWNSEAWLLRIGIKGFEVSASERPPANLVFLIDVSGSMYSPDKLPLLKNAFRLLTDQLTARENLAYVGRLQGLRAAEADRRIADALKEVRLDHVADRRVGTFSRESARPTGPSSRSSATFHA